MFITIEGIDGVGKSTQQAQLASWLRGLGYPVTMCRDPGSTRLGERIREVLLHEEHSVETTSHSGHGGGASSVLSVARFQVNIALNEDLTCSYKLSQLSSCNVEGVAQVRNGLFCVLAHSLGNPMLNLYVSLDMAGASQILGTRYQHSLCFLDP